MVAEKTDKTPESVEVKTESVAESEVDENKTVKKETPKKESFVKPCPASKKPKVTAPEVKKPEVSDNSEQSKPSEDATLILSAEEEAEVAAETNEDAVKTISSEEKNTVKDAKKKKDAQKNIWVSNISRSTKAADLKKLFSDKKFKVDSAKIVTNGRSFFGYICMDSADMAQKSAKELNGTTLAGRKIVVSLSRPDLRAATKQSDVRRPRDQPPKRDSRISNGVNKGEKATSKKETEDENKSESAKDAKDSTDENKDPEELERKRRRREQRYEQQIAELRTEVKRVNTELQNNRRRLTEATKRLDVERERKLSLRREMETLEAQLKSERRRHQQELEQLEKKRKTDELRYQDDRAMLNRELDECRKLREFLQRKIDDLGMSRHSRGSPPSRPAERSIDKLHRPRIEPRGRSPPPPPKINSRRSRDRSPPSSYKGKKPRLEEPSGKHMTYGNSHYQSQSYPSGSKPLLGHYPSTGPSGGPSRDSMYGSTSYPEHGRYGSSGSYGSGAYTIGNPPSLMSRPLGYPGSSSSQRKY